MHLHITHAHLMYIFQVGVNQQLYGQACWCWMQGLRADATVKFH